ncbi:MAG: DUF4430 domain-containing protein, partial [Bacillota bacterium]|nr:DUF4430 domain-containing protein [Bacillota bacterium]
MLYGNVLKRALAFVIAFTMVFSGVLPLGYSGASAVFAEGEVKITGVSISGEPIEGNTLIAVVTGEGGQEATNVRYQWKYYVNEFTGEYDDEYEEIWGDVPYNIENANGKELLLTYELVGKKIAVEVAGDLDSKGISEKKTVEENPAPNPDREILKTIVKGVGFTPLKPVFGTDTEILPLMRAFLDKKFGTVAGYEGVTLRLTGSNFPAVIGMDGVIHYFYKPIEKIIAPGIFYPNTPDSDSIRGNTYQPELTFEVSKGKEAMSFKKKVNVYWDIDKLKSDLNEKILLAIPEEMVRGANASFSEMKTAVVLPNRLEGKKKVEIVWETDNPNVLKIEEKKKTYQDTEYIITPQSVRADTPVKLYAKIAKYNFTNASTDEEKEIKTLSREFNLIVKADTAIDDELRTLQEKLENNLTHDKFKYSNSKESVDGAAVIGDFRLPIVSSLGIDKSYQYKISATSPDEPYLSVNSYRVNVIRPLFGSGEKAVRLTVAVEKKDNPNIKAERTLTFMLKEHGERDLSDAKTLMELVKASYFEGIKGENVDQNQISKDLHAFREAYMESGNLRWSYRYVDDKDIGVKPVDITGYDPMGSAGWRVFRSSVPGIISHENLRFTQPKYDTEVTIDSMLSSVPFLHYLKAYPDNAEIQALLNQPVSVTLSVKGTHGPKPADGEAGIATVRIKFYDGQNKQQIVPFGVFQVKSGLAKEWGYTGADVVKNADEGNVTMLDALVYFTTKNLGLENPSEQGERKRIRDSLEVNGGFVKTVLGKQTTTHPFSFYVNHTMSHDGVLTPSGEYTGYFVDNAVIKDGDDLTFLFYQKEDYSDYYAWFEQEDDVVKALNIPKDEPFKLTLKGYSSHYAFRPETFINRNTKALGGHDVCLINKDTGEITKIEDKVTDGKGQVQLSFDTEGDYLVTAIGNNTLGIIAPILEIHVTPGLSDEDRTRIIDADLAALTFTVIRGGNTAQDNVISNLNLVNAGASGKTSITWHSGDEDVITRSGVVKRPLNEAGDKQVTLRATVVYGDVSKSKDITVTVKKLPGSEEELEKIVGKLKKYITVEEYAKDNITKKDTNIIVSVREMVKGINPSADVENICEPSAEQTQIAVDGGITYGEKAVRNKTVKFVVTLGSAKKEFTPSVSVPARKATKTEALRGDWLTFDMFKGSNKSIDEITKDLMLISEESVKYDVDMTWTSDHPAVSIADYASNRAYKATVKRPEAGQPDITVNLTCTIKPGRDWRWTPPVGEMPNPPYGTKVFTIKIKAPTQEESEAAKKFLQDAIQLFELDEMNVRGTKEKVDLMNITYHFNNHPLNWNYVNKKPGYKTAYKNIHMEWKSENPGIVRLYSTCDIKRTAEDQTGDIVLTLSYDGVSLEKRWPTVVKAFGPNEVEELNRHTKKFADDLNFDLIKEKNASAINVLNDLKLIASWKIVNGENKFGIRKDYHENGVNIAWESSHPDLVQIKYNRIAVGKQPEKNTKVTLVATLSNMRFEEAEGVRKYTKAIRLIVPGTNDVSPTEEMLNDTAPDTSLEDSKALLRSIAELYRGKDAEWWKKSGSFWHATLVSAYSKDIEHAGLGVGDEIMKAFVDTQIKENLEKTSGDEAKASTDAKLLLYTINSLSAFGFDAGKITDSKGVQADAFARLNAIKLEDAKKGYFVTIAPYVLKVLRQGGVTGAEESAYIRYLVDELKNEANFKWGVDTPAMIIQGLAPYYTTHPEVKTAVDATLTKISEKQSLNGSTGSTNSDAMVIVALANLGINPHTDSRFVKANGSLVNGLLLYKLDDGSGFGFKDTKKFNDMATYQGAMALLSYIKLSEKEGVYDIFDFSALSKRPAVHGEAAPLGEVTVTILGEQVKIADRVRISLTNDAALLDLKSKGYVENNAGYFTPLHAAISAMEQGGRFTFTCKNGKLLPKISLQGDYGAESGWIYHVNGKYIADPSTLKLKNADKVLFFFNKGYDGTMYAAFEKDRHRVKVGEDVTIKVTGQPVKETQEAPTALQGARVLRNGKFEGLTDASGSYTLRNLTKGTHVITLEKKNAKGEEILISDPSIINVDEDSQGGGSDSSAQSVSVKFRLIGAVKNNGKYTKYVTWIATKTVTIRQADATVYDVFVKALADAGISHEAPTGYGSYWLGEFDNGMNSGWMYTVNGVHPQVGLKDMEVHNGDSIIWHYVYDYQSEESKNGWIHASDENPPSDAVVNMDETSGSGGGAAGGQTVSDSSAVNVNAATNQDGVAVVSLDKQSIDIQLEKIKYSKNIYRELKIEVKSDANAKAVEVALPKNIMTDLDRKVDKVSIATTKGKVSFDSRSLLGLKKASGNRDITVSISESNTQIPQLNERPVFEIAVRAGDEKIEHVSGRVEVTVPYEKASTEVSEAIVAYEVMKDGSLRIVNNAMMLDNGEFSIRGELSGTFVIGYNKVDFDDLGEEHWAEKDITFLAARGIVKGKGDSKA